jgi:hypothetical protein
MGDREPRTTLLLVGTGVLGGNVLDLLSWSDFPGRIVVAGRDRNRLVERVNLTRLASYNQGHYPRIEEVRLDLDEVERTAEELARIRPDVVFNATSVQTYWRISQLPRPVFRELNRPGVGPWLPMHLSPAYRLMAAIQMAGVDPRVVNGAYPDAVNPALATVGLAPLVGVGNVMNVVPALRAAAALVLGAAVDAVRVRLVAHHYVSNRLPAAGDTAGAPYMLQVLLQERDVTAEMDVAEVFKLLPTEVRRTRGPAGMYVTASSALAVLRALCSPVPVPVHAPGPHGLVGGYPVLASTAGVSLDLPITCSPAEAVAINERGQPFDGIQRIGRDGRVEFTPLATETMRRMLGHDCPGIKVADCHDWARELRARYLSFAERFRADGEA